MLSAETLPLDCEGSSVSGGKFILEKDIKLSVRDRFKLSADIFRPEADGEYPVILTMSPYQ